MATFTSFLGLRKPSPSDSVNVTLDLSNNLDAIDAQLKEIVDFLELAGILFPYGGDTAPTGFLMADGSAVSRATYAKTFGVCGTKFGAGNGVSTFNLPNVKGNVLIGLDGSQTEFNVIGKTGGAKTHTLSVAEMPFHGHSADVQGNHAHVVTVGTAAAVSGGGSGTVIDDQYHNEGTSAAGAHSHNIGGTGGGAAHNNLQPFLTVNWIMRAV